MSIRIYQNFLFFLFSNSCSAGSNIKNNLLKDYASSDEASDYEHEVDEKKEGIKNRENGTFKAVKSVKVSDSINNDSNGELFSSLPKPRKNFSFLEDNNKLSKLLLNKNSLPLVRKEGIKIRVPSASEFDSDSEQPLCKKIKPSSKGTGLFSVLPPPKNTAVKQSNLVPQAITKNQFKKHINGEETNSKVGTKTAVVGTDEEDDDDTLVGSSFFGSSLVEQMHGPELQSEYKNSDNILFKKTSNNVVPGGSFVTNLNIPEPNSNSMANVDEENQSYAIEHSIATETFSASDNPLHLDEKALQILCGNKKKRHQMPMNIIDLSSEEVLPDSKEWLLKQFTEEKRGRGHSHKKNQGPSSQSRRKHQITYLAYQAKEQELELQNQWANNRMSRKQTQSKYGF